MVSFDLWVHIHVDPPVQGWKVQLYWRSPDPWLVPPYTWVGPITGYTDATGEAFFDFGVSYTSPEYYPIPIIIVIPRQAYPGSSYHTYGGLTFERYEGPEWQVVGWSHFHKYLKVYPRGGKSADIVVRGKAIGGYPRPDMGLEILVNGSPVASRAIPGASIETPYELAGVLDAPGLHEVQGRMVLSNPLGSPVFSTYPVEAEILAESLMTTELRPKCDGWGDRDADPDWTFRDGTYDYIQIKRKSGYDFQWGYISFDLAGILGITDVEFGAFCHDQSGIGTGEDILLQAVQPFTCPFRWGNKPSVTSSLEQKHVYEGSWFKTSSSALLSYVQGQAGGLACFRLYTTPLSGSGNYFRFYTKENAAGMPPYLKVTYLKYA